MPKIAAPPKKAVCAVTGLPAKYFDPVIFPSRPFNLPPPYLPPLTTGPIIQVTKKPYANIAAFKSLRKIAA